MAATLDRAIAHDPRRFSGSARAAARAVAPDVADDRAGHAEGLDRAGRWSTASRSKGTFRSHQVPLAEPAQQPEHLADARALAAELSARGAVRRATERCSPALAALAPTGARRMGANPHANGGTLLRDLRMPDFRDVRGCGRRRRAQTDAEDTRVLGRFLRDVDRRLNAAAAQLPPVRPRRNRVEPARRRVRGDDAAMDGGGQTPTISGWRGTAGSWRCSASTSARAGSKGIC